MVETVVLTPGQTAGEPRRSPAPALALTGSVLALLLVAFVLGGGGDGSTVPSVERFVVDHVTQAGLHRC